MFEPGILATFSDVLIVSDIVVVIAIVIAIIVGALFVTGRIAPRTENTEPETDGDET
jgi:hypothetical protein